MWTKGNKDDNRISKGFHTPPPKWSSRPPFSPKPWMSEDKRKSNYSSPFKSQPFHVIHKVPSGDSPYVKAKHVQLIEKDPSRAVALFWNAINSGDRVDSALKDMAVVMKQLNRSNEAIEAIKSFRHLCSSDSQESLDNVLVELYKRSGRLEDQIEVLQIKLKRVEEGNTFAGKRVKLARSQGKKVHITIEQEYARLLGNLAWAYLQQNDYKTAEEYYRKALSMEPDRNKQCNLAVCLMCMNRLTEAKFLLHAIRASASEAQMDESYAKSFERAAALLAEMEIQTDKSLSGEEKENFCRNIGYFVSTADKESFAQSNVGTTAFASDSRQKRTYTPSVQARGILKSPFTQPKESSTLLDSGTKKGRTYWNEPVSRLPRRLQFDNPAASDCRGAHSETEQHGYANMNIMSIDSTLARNVLDRTTGEVVRNGNLAQIDASLSTSETSVRTNTSNAEGRDSNNEWVLPNHEANKSWADMVEEDEQGNSEENLSRIFQSVSVNENASLAPNQSSAYRSLLLNQQKMQDSVQYKRNKRLQVFQDMTPESPRA